MPLKSAPYKYQACEVKTITGKTFQIPAGTHNTVERQTTAEASPSSLEVAAPSTSGWMGGFACKRTASPFLEAEERPARWRACE